MELEGIGMKNSISYADTVSRQTATREPKAPAAEPVKKAPQASAAASVSVTAKGNETPVGSEEENVSRRMKNAIDKVNDKMRMSKTKCEFSYHEETKRVSIKVIDEETEEVIREIPPEETLEMLTKMWELAGLLVDEKR